MRDAIQEFITFNRPFARRNQELLRAKIGRMAESAFAFFRGTFHLFARDVLGGVSAPLPLFGGAGVEMDLVGDIHSENYGTFKCDDGEIHYDINDFDETTTGRFDFDVARLATSHFLAARSLDQPLERAVSLALAGLRLYSQTLPRVLARGREAELDVCESKRSGAPVIDGLVTEMSAAKRPAFFDKWTTYEGGKRTIKRSAKYYNLPDSEREQALRLVEDYRKRQSGLPDKADFFNVEDACGRVSGIGSMGRFRYVVLLTGKGSKEGRNVLLEFKEARPSAYDLFRDRERDTAAVTRRAERVVGVQRQSQGVSNRYLGFALDGEQSFQVRQLGPHDDRVEPKSLKAANALEGLVSVQMTILARVHARAAGRAIGPTNPLAELADEVAFCQRVLSFVLGYADVVQSDYQRFIGARPTLENVAGWMNE